MAAFVDTNILIYAFATTFDDAPQKIATARRLVNHLTLHGELIVSGQVLSEFAANAMKKGKPPLSVKQTIPIIERLNRQRVISIDASLVQLALQRVQQSRISYWDALIVEAAIRSGATILYTEDMHHGTRYNALELRNPFQP